MAPRSCGAHLTLDELHAPTLIDFEVVAGLRGLTLGGHLSAERAEDLLTDFDDLRIERWPAENALRRRAFQLRHNLSAHDAAYVALAEALNCPLVTRDARLARAPVVTAPRSKSGRPVAARKLG